MRNKSSRLLLLALGFWGTTIAQNKNYSVLSVDRNNKQGLYAVVLNNELGDRIIDIVNIAADTYPGDVLRDYRSKGYMLTSANYTGDEGKRVSMTLTKYENPAIEQHLFYKTWESLYDDLQEWTKSGEYQRTIAIDFNEFKNGDKDSLKMLVAVTKGLSTLRNVKTTSIQFEANMEELEDDETFKDLWKNKKRNIRFLACTNNNCYAILQNESTGFSQEILYRKNLTREILDEIYSENREIAGITSSASMWYILTEKRRARNQTTILSENYPENEIQKYLALNKLDRLNPVFAENTSNVAIDKVKIHGLFVGIDNYTYASRLPSCINDADSVYKYFKKFANLTNTAGTFKMLPDEVATSETILSWVSKIGLDASVGEHDMLILYFSGHGSPGYFCAYDKQVKWLDIKLALGQSKAKIKFVISDCCFAGTWDKASKAKEITNGNPEDFKRTLFSSTPGYVQLYACKENQVSLAGFPNSLFTEVFIDGLNGKADLIEKDGVITIEELYGYLKSKVPGRSEPDYETSCNDAKRENSPYYISIYCNNRQEPDLKGTNEDIIKLPISFLPGSRRTTTPDRAAISTSQPVVTTDTDKDGLPDYTDRCPNEYSTINGGCPLRKEYQVVVDSKNSWMDTGIDIEEGAIFSVNKMSGGWSVDAKTYPRVDGCGYTNESETDLRNYPTLKTLSSAVFGALLVKSGNGTPVALCKNAYSFSQGRLFMKINDEALIDNDGALILTVETFRIR